MLAEAQEAAAKVKEDAERHVKKMRRKLQQDRAALEEENVEIKRRLQEDRAALEQEVTSMEKAHTFQTSKILLNVGGHRFETSLQSLTSVPHTYFASLFSGRFELVSDAEGVYFIGRDGKNFHYILNFLRDSGSFKLSSNMMEEMQRDELAMELKFYGLLDRMMPFYTQERIGRALLKRVSRWLQVRAAAGGGSGTCARV